MIKNQKTILRKLFHNELSEEEQAQLMKQPAINDQLHKQWESALQMNFSNELNENKLWNKIKKRTIPQDSKKFNTKVFYYKAYSLIATILLIIGFNFILRQNTSPIKTQFEETYIFTSGLYGISSFILPDSTVVHLGSNSKLTYPKEFTGEARDVTLTGQGFFEVKKKSIPFIVHTSRISVTALGTAFEVFDYEENNKMETILLNGKVKISYNDNKHAAPVYLSPDHKMSYDKTSGTMNVEKVDASSYTSWYNQKMLNFENEKLSMVFPRLEQWYGCKIYCPEKIADYYRFTFKVRSEPIEHILNMICKSIPIRYEKENDKNYRIH